MTEPMRAEENYPGVRSSNVCLLCGGRKETGLVACRPCYGAYGLRYGNREAEAFIDRAESRLNR